MYSVDLSKIKIRDFVKLLKSIDLLPGRKILLDNLDEITGLFEQNKIKTLLDIQNLLKNKKIYDELAKQYRTSKDYLTVLAREVNSYVSKPVKLADISTISKKALGILGQLDMHTTKDVYDNLIVDKNSQERVLAAGLSNSELQEILGICDLLRINGVGKDYAHALYKTGIRSVGDYKQMPSAEILEKFRKVNQANKFIKTNLGIKDVEYCKRFCNYLDQDI